MHSSLILIIYQHFILTFITGVLEEYKKLLSLIIIKSKKRNIIKKNSSIINPKSDSSETYNLYLIYYDSIVSFSIINNIPDRIASINLLLSD